MAEKTYIGGINNNRCEVEYICFDIAGSVKKAISAYIGDNNNTPHLVYLHEHDRGNNSWEYADEGGCYYECSICGTYAGYSAHVDTNSNGVCDYCYGSVSCNHNWSDWTEDSSSEHSRTCSNCDKTQYESHDYETSLTCINRKCISCEHNEPASTGHDYSNPNTIKQATCTETGLIKYTCECGDTKTEDTPMIEHSPSSEWSYTTGENGLHWHECTKCGKKIGEEQHVPQCEDFNETHHKYTCEVCNQQIASAKHFDSSEVKTYEWSTTNAHDIICTCGRYLGSEGHIDVKVDSNTHRYVCKQCEGDAGPIPADGHSWVGSGGIKSATCTEAGIEGQDCTVCGAQREAEIPPLGHKEKYTELGDGTYIVTCERCEYIIERGSVG